MPAVSKSNLPAPFPKSEIAGIISPIIINGIAKFKNCPKKALKVVKILFIDSGRQSPKTMPRTMARKTLNNKFENKRFILCGVSKRLIVDYFLSWRIYCQCCEQASNDLFLSIY